MSMRQSEVVSVKIHSSHWKWHYQYLIMTIAFTASAIASLHHHTLTEGVVRWKHRLRCFVTCHGLCVQEALLCCAVLFSSLHPATSAQEKNKSYEDICYSKGSMEEMRRWSGQKYEMVKQAPWSSCPVSSDFFFT